jgi:hypothetical protein
MPEDNCRRPTVLKRLLNLMTEGNQLNVDLVLGLRVWGKSLEEKRFGANARTREEGVLRVETLMRGLDNPHRLAEGWVDKDGSVPPDTEAGLRARLSDEMAWCLRKGGVLLPSGEIRQDLPQVVEETIYELKPDLKDEVQRELTKGTTEGQKPTIIEGNFKAIS